MATVHQVWKITYKVLGVTTRVVYLSTTVKSLTPELIDRSNEAVNHDLSLGGHDGARFKITGLEWIAESVEINGQTARNAHQ
jgi:hypothetical protein